MLKYIDHDVTSNYNLATTFSPILPNASTLSPPLIGPTPSGVPVRIKSPSSNFIY